MKTRHIDIHVNNEFVHGADGVFVGAAGSHSDVVLYITFGELWEGLTKTICWHDARRQTVTRTLLTADKMIPGTNTYEIPIPAEPKAFPGRMTFSIKGANIEEVTVTDENQEEVTEYVEARATVSVENYFTVGESNYESDAADPEQPTPGVAQQLQSEIDTLLGEISGASASAELARQYAEASHDNAQDALASAGAAETAKQTAQAAQSAAEAAKESCEQILGVSFPAYPIVGHEGNTAITMLANHSYWITAPVTGALALVLSAPAANVDNEYRASFDVQGENATLTVAPPAGYTIKWIDGISPVLHDGFTYEISLLLFPGNVIRGMWQEMET